MQIQETPSLKLIMKILSKLKLPLKNLIETSEKLLNTNQENSLIQSTTKEDKKECWIELQRDGMVLIQFTLESSMNNNKDIETISKLIFKIIDKTKELNK